MKWVLPCAAALVMALAGCGSRGEDAVENMTALIVEQVAANQGPDAFSGAGIEISGPLSCQAKTAGDQFAVNCTGTSLDGQPVTLSGTAESAPGGNSVKGSFTGTSAGAQVFTTDCLGDCG